MSHGVKEEGILVEKRADGIFIIQINRPSKRNAIDSHHARLLFQAIKDFEASDSKVAILYGKGDFCTGFDLKEASSHHYNAEQELIMEWQPNSSGRGPMGPTRHFPSKPIIAAVTGYCVAGGLELALWCDLIVSHPGGTFGVFCRKVGVPLIDGGTIRLSAIIGLNRAREMILTGREVLGEEAYQWGLVNRICQKKDAVLEKSIQLAIEISKNPQITMLSDRRSLHESVFPNIDQKLYREFQLGIDSLQRGGAKQGVSDFLSRNKGIKPKL